MIDTVPKNVENRAKIKKKRHTLNYVFTTRVYSIVEQLYKL